MPIEAGSGTGSANDATIIVENNEPEEELAVEAEPKENN